MGLDLKIMGMKEFLRAFSEKRISGLLDDEQRLRMREAVNFLRGEVIEYIDQEKHGVPNAPLTVLIKKSSRPLVDRGDLRQSITTEVAGEGRDVHGAVGVLRRRRGRKGERLFNVAAALHNGFTIRMTPKVRAAIFAELRKRRGKKVKPRPADGTGARTIRVKGRPFISDPLHDNDARIVDILGDGVERWIMTKI
jgi:hypothetical protein